MNSDTLLNIALGLALLVWIGYRQLTWTPVVPEKMWRMPVILAVIGLVLLAKTGVATVSGSDVAVLALETVISLTLGAVMGMLAHFRARPDATATAASTDSTTSIAATLETRNGWFGMALWLVLIATRVAGEFWAHATGSALLMSTGVILLTVAANRGMRILVIAQRAARHPAMADRRRVAA